MVRLRIRRFVTAFVAACMTFFVLSYTRPYQPILISNSNIDKRFPSILTRPGFWRLPKFVFDISSRDEANTTLAFEFDNNIEEHIKEHDWLSQEDVYSIPYDTRFIDRLWFMKGGRIRPKPDAGIGIPYLWPEQGEGDRIVQQLMYVPAEDKRRKDTIRHRSSLKNIFIYYGTNGWGNLPFGRRVFKRDKCPVDTCRIMSSVRDSANFDAIIFRNKFSKPIFKRTPNQVWILYLLECPLNTQPFKNVKHVINWTATYRHDSDIVTPYEKYVPYLSSLNSPFRNVVIPRVTNRNFAANAAHKTKKVAWFVSNCNAKNKRLQYAYELSNYIDVDVFGSCGKRTCSKKNHKKCMDILDKDYKFYLSFENSNCMDYITEKYFINGLSRNLIPIVMGARREDYLRVSPPHSYIHVDDFTSPEELANYLHMLDTNDTMFNEYFAWKGSGEFINTHFWCRLCALLHAPYEHKSYADIHDWWHKRGTCNVKNGRDHQ